MYSNYNDLDSILNYGNQVADAYNWTIVALILSIVGGILAYFLFVKQSVCVQRYRKGAVFLGGLNKGIYILFLYGHFFDGITFVY